MVARYLAIYLLLLSATPAEGQDFMDEESFRQYQQQVNKNNCNFPGNSDRWGIREPNQEEILQWGRGILVFEYWNSTARCSDDQYIGIYYKNMRFMMEVVTGGMEDPREQVSLQVMDNPYHITIRHLFLTDGEEPGKIILFPLLS